MFHLKKPNPSTGESLIYMQFNYHGIKCIMSTERTINPAFWDKPRELPTRNYKDYALLKAHLSNIEDTVRTVYQEMIREAIPSKAALSNEIRKRLNVDHALSFNSFAENWIASRKRDLADKTYWNIKNTIKIVYEFNPKLTFDMITTTTMRQFRLFLLDKRKFGQNTASRIQAIFRQIINEATEEGLNKNFAYKTRKETIGEVETTQVYLTEKELDLLWNLKNLTPLGQVVRDRFLVACYTGVRFSDISKINKSNFRRDKSYWYFMITPMKTEYTCTIPAHPRVLEIMERNNWHLREVINDEFNSVIKTLCKKAGIDSPVEVITYPSGIIHREVKPKYSMVVTHTGRRTLICNLYLSGVPVETIMKISGHRTHKSFMKYLRLAPDSHMEVAIKSGFFTGEKEPKKKIDGLKISYKKTA